MDAADKNQIYDRLLDIHFEIVFKQNPDPTYINQKIGECHVYIEEVEKMHIRVSKEQSIVQRALNNALSAFDSDKDRLMSEDPEIKEKPSIRDREAAANGKLRDQLKDIKELQNEVSDLNNLSKAVNLKIKNLNRANNDIRMQLRIMEAQVKLGVPRADDSAARSLMKELNKSTIGRDSFEGAETKAEETSVVDPTEKLDIDKLNLEGVSTPDGAAMDDFDPSGLINPDPVVGENLSDPEDDGASPEELEQIMGNGVFDDDLSATLRQRIETETAKTTEAAEPKEPEENKKEKGGETPEEKEEKNENSKASPTQDAVVGQIDVDSLLSQFN